MLCSRNPREALSETVASDDISIATIAAVKNLGVIFYQDLPFEPHIRQISSLAFHHLHNINKIGNVGKVKESEK